MHPALLVVVLIVVIGVALLLEHSRKTAWNKALAAWATERGVEIVPASWLWAWGDIDGVPVGLESFVKKQGKSSTRWTRLKVATDLPKGTTLAEETTFIASMGKILKGDDIRTGDEIFDTSVLLRGDETELLARMTAPARKLALSVVRSGAKLAGATFVVEMKGTHHAIASLDAMVDTLVAFAKAARVDGSTVAQLARNAAEDEDAGVRARNLRELVEVFEKAAETRAAVAAGLADRAPVVRLEAARATRGPEAVPVLEGLVASAADAGIEDHVRLAAAAALAERAPGSAVLAQAQSWLVLLLNGESPTLAVGAADTLGAFAGIDTVEALLAHTRGVFKHGDLKEAAVRAVAAIQSRAGGAAGALSLVDAAPAGTGALSLADSD